MHVHSTSLSVLVMTKTQEKEAEINKETLKFNEVRDVYRFDYTVSYRNNLIPDFNRMPIEATATIAEYFQNKPAAFQPGLKKDCESFAFCCTLGYAMSAYQMKMLIIAFGTLKMFDKECFDEMMNLINSDKIVTLDKTNHSVKITSEPGKAEIIPFHAEGELY
ncbi:unnamed protein product [Mytilus edulis]|uniref:Uncharacterized protein n=1 Tax=Mytilus edulis TaxID=6550 RepID=A0A8S3PTA2_MYTED|nr:unnamed protein product [Mytilus edulis]